LNTRIVVQNATIVERIIEPTENKIGCGLLKMNNKTAKTAIIEIVEISVISEEALEELL
jgi:hypothetical protein